MQALVKSTIATIKEVKSMTRFANNVSRAQCTTGLTCTARFTYYMPLRQLVNTPQMSEISANKFFNVHKLLQI